MKTLSKLDTHSNGRFTIPVYPLSGDNFNMGPFSREKVLELFKLAVDETQTKLIGTGSSEEVAFRFKVSQVISEIVMSDTYIPGFTEVITEKQTGSIVTLLIKILHDRRSEILRSLIYLK
ncbi:hypothetical protein JW758_05320 [Candidatus Peregrinibacteria bacterium]|nr:hypothetical protein [Candidatus Peregrinibacteria bacterium]